MGQLIDLCGKAVQQEDIKSFEKSMRKYYSFSIEPEKLLKIGYVLHRNEANSSMKPTYQRIIKKKRLNEVREFINNGGYFPNSIIISLDTEGKGLVFDQASQKIDNTISRIGILHIPKKYRSAYIIDGQHRLYIMESMRSQVGALKQR